MLIGICGKTHLHLRKTIKGRIQTVIVLYRCKSWGCPTCRQHKAMQVRLFMEQKFKQKKLYMWTLTFDHKSTPENTWKNIAKAWNRFRTYAKQTTGAFNYIKVIEPHKDGLYPHLHILIDRYINVTKATKHLKKQGFGWNMHVKALSSKGARSYVSKYLTKEWPDGDAEHFRKKYKIRRFSASRALGAVFPRKGTWELLAHDDTTLSIFDIIRGYRRKAIIDGEIILNFTADETKGTLETRLRTTADPPQGACLEYI